MSTRELLQAVQPAAAPRSKVPALIPAVADSREQRPYQLNPEVFDVTVAALPAGDYSLRGFETRVAIERKSVQDFVGSITGGRDRFLRELEKLRRYEFAAIVVEGSIEDLRLQRYRSLATPVSVLGTTWALIERYVPIVFAGGRVAAQVATEGLLARWWKDERKRIELADAGFLEKLHAAAAKSTDIEPGTEEASP